MSLPVSGQVSTVNSKLAATLETIRIEDLIRNDYWFGRPSANRKAMGRTFVAKAVNNATTTCAFRDRILSDPALRRMCGWEKRNQVPSEATFSRVFAEFAESRLCERVHEALIKRTLSDQGRNTGS